MANTVRNLLIEKGGMVWIIDPSATVFMALQKMEEKNIGALIVVGSDKILGIITERDYARKVALKGKESKKVCVSDIMTSNVVTVNSSDSIEECMAKMAKNNIRHLPVIENGRLFGMLSMRDVVSQIISKQKDTIDKLEGLLSEKGYRG